MKTWDIKRVIRDNREKLNGTPYLSLELAITVAKAHANQTPIPGVIEIWEHDWNNDTHTIYRTFVGRSD